LFTEYSYAFDVASSPIKMSYENEKEHFKVLLICYDPTLIGTVESCLKLQGGLCIETASSNDEALTKIKKTRPDVIVGDFTGLSMTLARKVLIW
jgi:PleD family two-component response regulator